MEYVLACDCGGSKCAFLLCAADGTVAGAVTGGTANSHFEAPEAIAKKIGDLLCRLRRSCGEPEKVVAWGGVLMVSRELIEPLVRENFPNCTRFFGYRESEVNLMASAGAEEGLLAHSGTGSFVSACRGGREYHYGGLGSYLGDEGSGYYTGLAVFDAVKRDLAGLGPATALRPMLFREWDIKPEADLGRTMWALAAPCIAVSSESRLRIAKLTYLAARAAAEGDAAATGILRRSAAAMAEQVQVLVEREGYEPRGILTVSGGTWHCGPAMLDTFFDLCLGRWPDLIPVRPRLEPIGGVALCLLRDALGLAPNEARAAQLPRWEM